MKIIFEDDIYSFVEHNIITKVPFIYLVGTSNKKIILYKKETAYENE